MGVLINGTIQHSKGAEANLANLAAVDGAIAIIETAGTNVEIRVGDDQSGTTVWRDPLSKLKTDVATLQTTIGLVSAKLTTDDAGHDTLQEVLDFIEAVQASITSGAAVVTWSNVSGKPATFPPDAHNHDTSYYTQTQSDAKYLEVAAKAADADKLDGFNSSTTATANTVPVRDASAALAGDILGNSATTTKLATARTITAAGAATGSASFDGSANVTLTLALAVDGIKAPSF